MERPGRPTAWLRFLSVPNPRNAVMTCLPLLRRAGLGLALALFIAAPALAQWPGPEQMRAHLTAQAEETIAQLDLTDEKADAVRPILLAAVDARVTMMEERRQSGARRFGALREQMQTLAQETEAKLAAVLTDAELERYRAIQAEHAAKRRGRAGFRNGM